MASDSALPPVIGAIAEDRDGNALGTVTAVFVDDATERPTWVGLTSGLHATADPDDVAVVAPITDAVFTDGRLRLAVPAAAVRSAPHPASPDRLGPEEESMLRAHYRGDRTGAVAGTDTALTDSAMTRSEEQVRVRTVVEPWTRAVLRVEEVTEEVMVPVTVTRQRARIEYRPLAPGDADRPDPTPDDAGAQRRTSTTEWVTLWGEQPRVTMERVPVEKVRLATSWTTEEQLHSDQVRREQIELSTTDTDATPPPAR
ncbi:YsnF/AvaK domain-containing protein [Modestobacter sp. I12A-02662]|uniref:YsnF/AvaK domain-containing protein n=1 Tax=Modestobacter sp. I12A-02662 TaxID=1730496 RepID=UPI0034E03C62